MEPILENQPNKKLILLGNEAIVRGALESGVQFVSTYPGTPASEIGNIFSQIAKNTNIYFEFSTNEKVALEAGIGASFSGLKTLVAMKSFGLNVCSDALLPFLYTGSKGPTVIIVGDDPSCWSSAQSEEDSRAFSYLAHIPTLDPSDPQECKDFTKLAFQISEKFKIPVMLRTTTRVAHQRAPVELGKFNKKGDKLLLGEFIKDPKRFVTLPPRVLEMKEELLEKIEKIKQFSEKSSINQVNRDRISVDSKTKTGVITSGISYLYVKEALKELNLNLPILKLGFFYPLPEKKIKNFLKNLKKVLIIEELEPYLEKEIQRLAKEVNCKLQVIGKELIPKVGELRPEIVVSAIAKFANCKLKIENSLKIEKQPSGEFLASLGPGKLKIPRRSPQFCPGCYYRLVFQAVKKVAPKDTIFGGDIGCYMMAGLPPFFMQDYLSCMGSSIGIAHGIRKATNQKLIAFIGDSTFFHAGIPALINTVFNKSNPLIIILDNQTTAMTGHQPHPGSSIRIDSDYNGLYARYIEHPARYKFAWAHSHTPKLSESEAEGGLFACIKIEDIVKACGVQNIKVIDPINIAKMEATIKEFLEKDEVSVIIARRLCWLLAQKKG